MSATVNGTRGGATVVPQLVVNTPGYRTRRMDPFTEVGTSGLRQYGGFVLEEWLAQLQGRRAAWVWREMLDNDPIVGAVMFAIRWLARSVEYRVEDGDPRAAMLVETSMHDMSHTWGDFISDALSFLPYGWAFMELVYKRRSGQQPERPVLTETAGAYTAEDDSHVPSSKHDDGLIGWRKIPVRAQETLLRWGFDGYSGLSFMEQIDWHGGQHKIPIQKAVLFRTQTTRNNPEGRSILRNAYTSYFAVKNIRQIEAIGIERDLAGIPVATPPDGVDLFAPGNTELLSRVQELVTQIRRDQYEGVVLPSAGWKLELLSTGGGRQFDTDKIVRRYRQDIALSMLADFVLIGQDAVGSYAMVEVKSDMFGVALDGILDLVCEVLNSYAIPRLLRMNGMSVEDPPQIRHSSARKIDLDRVGSFLQAISLAGAPIPWSMALLKALFADAGLPAEFNETEQLPAADPGKPGDPAKPDAQENLEGERVGVDELRAGLEKHDRPTVSVDFDGVIHRGSKGGQHGRNLDAGKLMPGARKGLRALHKHFRVVVCSARHDQNAVKAFLKHHHLDGLVDKVTRQKPAAIAYLDDRAIRFHSWPDAVRQITVRKSQRSLGTTLDIGGQLQDAHRRLSGTVTQEILAALGLLGEQAATVWEQQVGKAAVPAAVHRLVSRVIRALNLPAWIESTLKPILRNHASRTIADTQRLVSNAVNGEVQVADQDAQRIIDDAGGQLGWRDIEPQVRDAILQAVSDGLQRGENPTRVAGRIRGMVPAGRFVHAGSEYRARLIARNETANMQRQAALAAYRSNPHVTGVELRDGIYGPPRSDSECIGRDGRVVPLDEAGSVHPLHPQCTLSFLPVVTAAGVPVLPPVELIAA